VRACVRACTRSRGGAGLQAREAAQLQSLMTPLPSDDAAVRSAIQSLQVRLL
jgi:hypothetical protein